MRTTQRTKAGFTLVEIMIVVAIIGLLVAIAIPNYFKTRELAQKNTCLSNLRVIDTAKQMWSMETGKSSTAVPTDADLVGAQLYIRTKPKCPGGGTYTYLEVSTPPDCDVAGHDFVTASP